MEPLKGIVQQMDEHFEAHKNDPPLTQKELTKLMEDASERSRKVFLEKEKSKKENFKHLEKRSKELGKPIPTELMVRVAVESVPVVGSDFIERYKEWLT